MKPSINRRPLQSHQDDRESLNLCTDRHPNGSPCLRCQDKWNLSKVKGIGILYSSCQHVGIFDQFLVKQPKFVGTKMRLKKGIAERDLPDSIASSLLQIVRRCIVCCLQVICRLFAVRDPYLDFYYDSVPFPLNFRGLKKKRERPTD